MNIEDRKTEVYDIETLQGVFTYIGINPDTEEIFEYVIHPTIRNDYVAMIEHILSLKGMIGFNNIDFDYPIIHLAIDLFDRLKTKSGEEIIGVLYEKAQKIITQQGVDEKFNRHAIKERDWKIKQLDLYKLWHFNNKARRTSLKALEISMNFPNVMEMELHHSTVNISKEQLKEILKYNLNDVRATLEFYKRSAEKIKLRKGLNSKYNLGCLNFSDSKIGEQLVLKLYCDKTGKDPWNVKQMRTNRESIALRDCIFPYIDFQTKEFNNLLSTFNKKVITGTKNAIEESVIYKGFKYDFGTGGIHGCIKPGIYESDEVYIILDADVASLYPSIAILNGLYPEHLGQEFCDVYDNEIVKPRLAAKKAGDMTMADGFKLSANSVYGKSNDEYSFLKDPMYTMKTTINGELMLSMLAESLVNGIDDLTMLQINTDGLTVKIRREDIEKYYSICKEWENTTKLTLEYVEYNKMVIRDVNNYLSISTKDKIKYKGAFEIDKDYHKDNSFRIVPLALSEFFVKGIAVEDTIKNHKNIYDFCGRQKFRGEDWGETHEMIVDSAGLRQNQVIKQQKHVRYYISKPGKTFIKNYRGGGSEIINKGFQVTVFNKYISKPMEDYKIDLQYYVKECYKEINIIIDKQLDLF
jgi:hypothetical protein